MKRNRIFSIALSVLLLVTLMVPFASADATDYPDLVDHWSEADCRKMISAGMFIGYDDGTFRPDRQLTTTEALVLCARMMGIDNTTSAKVLLNRADELYAIFGYTNSLSWAYEEFALCLEAGIVSYSELNNLYKSGVLSTAALDSTTAISKEDLAMYMVRAMQLDVLAASLTSNKTSFADDSSISSDRKSYVYLMSMYSIVKGDEYNNFGPSNNVTRAVMATMISRALDQMETRGISIELGEYTSYSFYSGVISELVTNSDSTITITLNSAISGSKTVTVNPGSVAIYENNMKTTSASLKTDQFIRIALNSAGNPTTIRILGGLTEYTGTITSIDEESITISTTLGSFTYPLSRFTEVKAGSTVGDRSLITSSTIYDTAICRIDGHGNLAQLELSGGSVNEWGIIFNIEATNNVQYLYVRYPNGDILRHAVASDVEVIINTTKGYLSSSYIGKAVTLSYSNDTKALESLTIDSNTTWVQGSFTAITSSTNRKITVNDFIKNTSKTYTVSSGAELYYEDEALSSFSSLASKTYVTMRVSGTDVYEIYSYPGTTEITGKLLKISYGDPIVMAVQRSSDSETVYYSIDPTDLPTVKRNSTSVSFDKLVVGDAITVTSKYRIATSIVSTSQAGDVTGTITKITIESTSTTFELKLSSGEVVTYTALSSVPVTQNNNSITLSSLKIGDSISLVLDTDSTIQAIERTTTTTSSNSVSGKITFVSDYLTDGYYNFIILDETTNANVTVAVEKTVTIYSTTGSSVTLSKLTLGRSVTVYYEEISGLKVATLIVVA